MEWSTQPIFWIVGILVAALAAALTAWLKRFFGEILPSPQRAVLIIKNWFKTKSPRPKRGFRFVLCWLENDTSGRDTIIVKRAFAGIQGVELVCSARIVEASDPVDDQLPAMCEGTRKVLDEWDADLAIVGSVVDPGRGALALWFVAREGDDALTLRGGSDLRIGERDA